jgi:uncharacterized protein YbaR (Trm112 family)
MAFDATLLELLACPSDDHAPLREAVREGAPVLVCTFCRSSFPIEDGIPVLLLDEATAGPNGLGHDASAPAAAERKDDGTDEPRP